MHGNQNKGQGQATAYKYTGIEIDPMKIIRDAKAAVDAEKIELAAQIIIYGEPSLRKIVDKNPNRTDIMYAVAAVFHIAGKTAEAEQWYKKILARKADASVYNRLAQICENTSRLCEAVRYHTKAAETDMQDGFRSSLATSLVRTGRVEEGIAIFRKLIEKSPDRPDIHSNFLANLHYLPQIDQKMFFDEHKKWGKIHAPVNPARISYDNTAEPDRRLRIGYMSPDFREHSVTYFFEPLLDEHDRKQVEVYGYGSVVPTDHVTERLKLKFNHYRDISGLDDEKAADLIKQDRIDILVDLAGHTKSRRLFVLAQRPAPIQITYLGYADTTGMEQVNYRLTDALTDSPQSQKFYTEELIYLPRGFLCYKPSESTPPAGPLPAEKKGYVTFGSFNNNCKINPYIIEIWAQILKGNSNSRFLMKFYGGNEDQLKNYYLRQFEQYGVNPERIEIFGWVPQLEHFKLYEQMDIALDTYPYNGATTTCEALWMGVPVISLVGEHHVSRVGLSILSRVGMEFFAAKTPQEYVAKANALAAKPDTLAQLRSTMRTKIINSILCDAKGFTGSVEAAYRKIWHRWCQSQQTNAVNKNSKTDVQCGSKDTQKQKMSFTACDATPLSESKKLSSIAELAVKVDTLCKTGHQAQATQYASEGWNRLNSGEKAGDIPPEILQNWNARNEEILFIRFCISLIRYSGFYEPLIYIKLFNTWANMDINNPLPYLRLGLAMALAAKRTGLDMPPVCLEALRYADNLMQDERSAAALALVQGKIRELSLPYDGGRINLYPDLQTLTTYVLLEQGDWFEDELVLFRNLIRPEDKVLDLGANVGVYAISAALCTNRQGRVIALEPAAKSFKLLNASAEAFPNMTAVHAGVSNENGTGWLCHGESSEMNLFGDNEQNGEKVDLFSVDDLAEKMKVECFDIIKMDVEGYEQRVLEGARKIIGENSPIIFYEFRLGSDYNFKLINTFAEMGYDSYCYVKGTSTLIKLRKGMQLDAHFLNMVAFRPESIQRIETVVKILAESDCQFSESCCTV